MKLGDIGEEMVATAVALAKERGASVEAVFVVRVPRAFPLEGALPEDVRRRAEESLAEARRPRRGERRRGRRAHHPGPLDRSRDRRRGPRARRRPDRARLVAALAAPVAVLLADRRPRPSQRSLRGARRRLPGRNLRVDATLRAREGRHHRVWARRLGGGEGARRRRLGRHRASTRTRTRSRGSAPGRAASSSGTAWTGTSSRRPASPRRRRPSSRPTATTRTS